MNSLPAAQVDTSVSSGRMLYKNEPAAGVPATVGTHSYNTSVLPKSAIRAAIAEGRPFVRWTIGMTDREKHPWCGVSPPPPPLAVGSVGVGSINN